MARAPLLQICQSILYCSERQLPSRKWGTNHINLCNISRYLSSASSNYYLLQDDDRDPPIVNRSGQPINYALPANKPNIGHGAPSLTNVATGKKHKLSNTKVTTRKKKKSPGQSSTAALTPQTGVLVNPSSPPSEGNILNFSVILFYPDTEHIFDLLSRCSRGSI